MLNLMCVDLKCNSTVIKERRKRVTRRHCNSGTQFPKLFMSAVVRTTAMERVPNPEEGLDWERWRKELIGRKKLGECRAHWQ